MRYSEMFLPTGREIPSDAEVISHKLMIRAGMIRKLTSGIYSYLPLGVKVIQNVERIIREEMNRTGAQEVFLPIVQPRELWDESGRWTLYGKELLRFKDRNEREFCLGPTHEEVITDLVRSEIKSYRQLPKNLYQIQIKFRDEIRPRFGVMRCREFSMKDAYSFDINEEEADKSYKKMFDAYSKIFSRCGLKFRAVEADTGSIGGSFSHEFMVIADSGEDALVFCDNCSYAANLEKAEFDIHKRKETTSDDNLPVTEIFTPDIKKIEDVCSFLKVESRNVIKTLIYTADGVPVAVLIRGDDEVNEIKLKNYLKADVLEMAKEDVIQDITGSPRGFAGAIGIKSKIIADYSLMGSTNFVMGANKKDYHMKNVNIGRDFKVDAFADIRFAKTTDRCSRCGAGLKFARGIEVGHVFKLGLKYSKALKATYLNQNGQEKFMVMGCYGIGIGRTVAATIEQNYDQDGIVWPIPISPYKIIITPVNVSDANVSHAAENLYKSLIDSEIDVIIDDRDERAGVKFKDADLIGVPMRATIGSKKLADGNIEIKIRKTGKIIDVRKENVKNFILEYLSSNWNAE